MRVSFHSAVQPDVNKILRHYDQLSNRLGDEFWYEVSSTIERIEANPLRYHPAFADLRRANLNRFPYHLLYRVLADRIRIVAVRHHKQHPRTALARR